MSGRGRGRNTNARGNARSRGRQPRAVARRQSQDDNQSADRHEPVAQSSNSSSSSSASSNECEHPQKTLTRTVLEDRNVLITDQTCKSCGKLLGTTTSSLLPSSQPGHKKRVRSEEVLPTDESERQDPKRQKTQQQPLPEAPPVAEPVILTREQKAAQDWKSMTRTTFSTLEHQLPRPTYVRNLVQPLL